MYLFLSAVKVKPEGTVTCIANENNETENSRIEFRIISLVVLTVLAIGVYKKEFSASFYVLCFTVLYV